MNDRPTDAELYQDHLRLRKLMSDIDPTCKGYDEATFLISSNQSADLAERCRLGEVITVTIGTDPHSRRMMGKVERVEFCDDGWELCLSHLLSIP